MSRCKCKDGSGTVMCWSKKALLSLRDDGPVDLSVMALACPCARGAKHSVWFNSHGGTQKRLDRFGDHWSHVPVTVRDRTEYGSIYSPMADAQEFGSDMLKTFLEGKPANYVNAFDDFNAAGD